jgi:hypothetical protein
VAEQPGLIFAGLLWQLRTEAKLPGGAAFILPGADAAASATMQTAKPTAMQTALQ